MKSNFKTWFLYGTLFSALGFVVSGNDPQLDGHIQFSSNERVPNAQQLATALTPAQIAKAKAAAAKREAEKINANTAADSASNNDGDQTIAGEPAATAKQSAPKEEEIPASVVPADPVPIASATAPTSTGASRTSAQRGNNQDSVDTRSAPGRITTETARPAKFAEMAIVVEGTEKEGKKSYNVSLVNKDGITKALYYEQPEGKECSDCSRNGFIHIFNGENADNFTDVVAQLKYKVIPEAQKSSRETSITSTNSDDEETTSDDTEQVDSVGMVILKKKISKRCGRLDGNAELECKTRKFLEILKAEKKMARKDKKHKKKSKILDEDAAEYFTAEIKDYLKEMLTHKFSAKVVTSNDSFERRELLSEYYDEKRTADKEKTLAKNLIKDLLRQIGSEYDDTRKEISSLYKYSLEEQAQEVQANLIDLKMAKSSNDTLGMQTSWGSFLENFRMLGSINNDLYGPITESLRLANRDHLLESDPFREILREINGTRTDILRDYLNNDKLLNLGSNSALEGPNTATNAARSQRGNGVMSGTMGSSLSPLNRTGSSFGGRNMRGQ